MCDGDDFGDLGCTAMGYASNDGAVCSGDCGSVDTSGCAAVCGNGVVEPGEQCDNGSTQSQYSCASPCPTSNNDPNGSSGSGCNAGLPASPALFFMLFTFRRRRRFYKPGSGSSSTGS
jgi:cysteine-rich repeat protein